MNDTDRQAARYVDGEMDRGEAAAFEARLRDRVDLRERVDAMRGMRALFEPERRAARAESLRPYEPSPNLRAKVLSQTVRGPAPVREDEALAVARQFGQRVLYAAAAVVLAVLAGAAWTLGSATTGQLDARIRARAEAAEGR